MSEIHGFAVDAAGAHLLPYNFSPEELQANEVEIKISHCGIRHSDVHRIDSDRGFSKYPFIPGHEVVGTVIAVGPSVHDRKVGERARVGGQADSCGICEWCRQGDEHLCAQSQPTCAGGNGGYADKIRVNSRFAIPLPDALESEATAPLLWAGVTVYRPLQNHGVKPSSRVGWIGIGGLSHLGIRFAKAFSGEVTAFSTAKENEVEAKKLGAHNFVNSPDTGALKKVGGHRLSAVNDGEPRRGRAGVYQRSAANGNALRYRRINLCPANSALFLDRRRENGVCKPDGKPPRFLRDGGRPCPKQYQSTSEPFAMAKANDAIARVKKGQIRYRAGLAN